MRTFYTSDWHFGHANIITYCPSRVEYLGLREGATVTDMNEALVRLWNGQVNHDDVVYVIGDMCMGKVAETLEYVKRLNGTKHLVLGNHDRPHPICTAKAEKREEWKQAYTDAGFVSQAYGYRQYFDGVLAEVSHFPYYGDHTEERYNADVIGEYVPVEEGLPLVHGHVHDMWQVRGNMLNVGIDAWDGQMLTPEFIGAYFRDNGYAK